MVRRTTQPALARLKLPLVTGPFPRTQGGCQTVTLVWFDAPREAIIETCIVRSFTARDPLISYGNWTAPLWVGVVGL